MKTKLPTVMMLATLVVAAQAAPAAPPTDELVIVVSGVRNDQGLLNVAIFADEPGFPEDTDAAAHVASIELRDAVTTPEGILVRIPGVAPGSYAAIVLHDENRNLRMDRNRLGMPREGYGVSNDARNRMSAPRFAAARFDVAPGPSTIHVRVRY